MHGILPFGRNSWCCEVLLLRGLYHYCFMCRALLLHVPSTTGQCHGVLLVGVASSSGALSLLPRSLRDDLEKWERLYGACFYRVGGQ